MLPSRSQSLALAITLSLALVIVIAGCDDGSASSASATPTARPAATVTADRGGTPPAGVAPSCAAGADTDACDFAAHLATWATNRDANSFAILISNGQPEHVTCTGSGTPDSTAAFCRGAVPGDVRDGYPVALHGSEGTYYSPLQLRNEVTMRISAGATMASAGCAGAACEGLIVAFATGSQPAALYLAFERARSAGGYTVVGYGLSGDNAGTILHGGTTNTLLGGVTFSAWVAER